MLELSRSQRAMDKQSVTLERLGWPAHPQRPGTHHLVKLQQKLARVSEVLQRYRCSIGSRALLLARLPFWNTGASASPTQHVRQRRETKAPDNRGKKRRQCKKKSTAESNDCSS